MKLAVFCKGGPFLAARENACCKCFAPGKYSAHVMCLWGTRDSLSVSQAPPCKCVVLLSRPDADFYFSSFPSGGSLYSIGVRVRAVAPLACPSLKRIRDVFFSCIQEHSTDSTIAAIRKH